MQWFSDPQPTKEQAQDLHNPLDFFDPAAVFKSAEGFVMGRLRRDTKSPPHQAAKSIQELTGYEMVSYCTPLMQVWVDYEGGSKSCAPS